MSGNDVILYGERADVRQTPPRVYAAGRVCDVPRCGTKLSIYNSSTSCAAHSRFTNFYEMHHPRHQRQPRRARAAA